MKINENTQIGDTGCKLESLVPYLLYSNDNGTNGNITLNDSVANYTYIEVYYYTQYNNRLYSNKFYKPNGKDTMFFYLEGAETNSQVMTNDTFVFWSGVRFENNTINRYTTKRGLTSLSGSYGERGDRVFITRVVGYK